MTTTPIDAGHLGEDRAQAWFRPGLAVIAGLGLVLRLVYLVTSKVNDTPVIKQGDAFWYSATAQSLASGRLFINKFIGQPTAEHPPLTPLLLTPVTWLSTATIAQRLMMVLFGTAVVVVVGLAGRYLGGPRAGLGAAAVAAVLPSLWINDVLVMSETITALMVALLIWAAIRLHRQPTTRLAAIAGALCGLTALARAETGLLLPLLIWAIIVVNANLDWRGRIRLIAVSSAGAALVLAPWIGLNLSRFENPVAISTNDGLTFAGANCTTTYQGALKGDWVITPCVTNAYARIDAEKPGAATPAKGSDQPCPDNYQKRMPCLDASQVSTRLRSAGLDYMTGHLNELPGVVLARNGRVWGAYQITQSVNAGTAEGRSKGPSRAGFYATWALLPVSVAGLVLLRRRGESLLPYLAPLAVVVVTTSAFTGLTPRIRVPWDVASCLLAGVVMAAVLDRRLSRDAGATPEPIHQGSTIS